MTGNEYTGDGATTADSGSYDWKTVSGNTGKTEITANPDGTLTLRFIYPSGGENWYVGIYQPGLSDPYAPPKSASAKPAGAKPAAKPKAP